MSATNAGAKSKWFGLLKGIFHKPESNGAPAPEATAPQAAAPPVAVAPKPAQDGNGNGNGHAAQVPARRKGAGVNIPLHLILAGLPLELRARVQQTDVGDLTIFVPLEKILSQLAQGAVKIPFGDVRQLAAHVFTGGAEADRIAVLLPLNEILSQLNPALLVRRQAQRSVEVPSDIISPFDAKGQGLVFSVGNNAKPVPPAAPRQMAPAPATPARGSISAVPTPPPASALPASSLPAAAPIPMPKFTAPAAPAMPISSFTPATPARPAVNPTPVPIKHSFQPIAPQPVASQPVASQPSVSQPVAAQPAKPATDAESLTVALKALAETWPDALRQEIVQLGLVNAQLALPYDVIEAALKRGRAAFPWKTLRSWIRPATQPAVSAHDAVEVELSLMVIAPLFLAHKSAAGKVQPKLTIDENIPNLFFGFPKPDAPAPRAPAPAGGVAPGNLPAAVAKPADTNYYVWSDTSESARVDETEIKRAAPAGGTDFVRRCATPNEIVSRAAVLDGVAGAIIALPDGLLVASRIPAELNGDTLAAFLPQMFAKVNQCTRELRMGDLNNLNFTVGNVPWKIFRVNAIFFAAFGRVAEPLPTGELAALASELDRKR